MVFWRPWSDISIHAPREGSDDGAGLEGGRGRHISIHAPREGSDNNLEDFKQRYKDFYPRSPRGERLGGVTREE